MKMKRCKRYMRIKAYSTSDLLQSKIVSVYFFIWPLALRLWSGRLATTSQPAKFWQLKLYPTTLKCFLVLKPCLMLQQLKQYYSAKVSFFRSSSSLKDEIVTPHTHNVNGIFQTWRTFVKIVYSLYSKNYDVQSRNM